MAGRALVGRAGEGLSGSRAAWADRGGIVRIPDQKGTSAAKTVKIVGKFRPGLGKKIPLIPRRNVAMRIP